MKDNFMSINASDADSDSYLQVTSEKRFITLFLIILSLSVLMRAYYMLRYNFLVLDSDSILITKTVASVELSGSIHSTTGYIYSNGFGYQLYSATASLLSGIPAVSYQLYLRPLLGAIVTIVSYLFFSAYFKERRIVLLLMVLLLVSPITLFETTRASHMAMDVSFLLLAFYILKKYFDDYNMRWLFLFLPVLVCMDITNVFMGLIINMGLVVAVLIRSYFRYRPSSKPISIKSLGISINYIIFIIFTIQLAISIYLHSMMFHNGVYLLDTVLSVSSSDVAVPMAYTYVMDAWKFPLLYWTVIALYNITILPLSLILFIYVLYHYLVKRCPLSTEEKTVTSVFGIWGLLTVVAILVDLIGAGGIGSNLQLRITTLIIPFSLLLIGYSITLNRPTWVSTLFKSKYVVLFLCIFMVGSLLYITADPLVSNSWRYSTNYEKNALFWLDDKLEQPTTIWRGDAFVTGSRLSGVYSLFKPISSEAKLDFVPESTDPKYYLDSPIISDHYNDLDLIIPYFQSDSLIYANGDGRMFIVLGATLLNLEVPPFP
jgi:hypothetical protein